MCGAALPFGVSQGAGEVDHVESNSRTLGIRGQNGAQAVGQAVFRNAVQLADSFDCLVIRHDMRDDAAQQRPRQH
ncbi:hypothetical protein D9M68_635400 [compost metagenome]